MSQPKLFKCLALLVSGKMCTRKSSLYPKCRQCLRASERLCVKRSVIKGAGLGLFYVGEKIIRKGEHVAFYSGATLLKKLPVKDQYIFEVSRGRYLSAKNSKNYVGRYVNDASHGTGRKNNIAFVGGKRSLRRSFRRWTTPMIATRMIRKGDELYVNYGDDYWG
jgi:hypothetical protein